ncbi:MAG: TolC family protein, partial [Acidobacteriota bacterium]
MRRQISAVTVAMATAFLLAFLALPLSSIQAFTQEPKTEKLSLTLKECIARALANNLDLAIEAFSPDIDDASISESREKYLPELGLGYGDRKQTVQSPWGLEGTSFLYRYDNYSVRLSQRLVTGGSATLSFSNSMTDSTRAFTQINPAYNSTIQLSLTQPLLKDFGPKANRIDTLRAINQRELSISALNSKVIQTIFDVESAYWNLYSAIENLRVREYALEQSREIHRRNQEGERMGTKSAIDVLSSEAEVAQYEDSVVSARLVVEQNEARLGEILNLPVGAPPVTSQPVVPSDKPLIEKKDITYEEALKMALGQRPEITQFENQLENNANDISYYKNQALPQLDLNFETWSPGQSGIKLIYKDNNPLTGIVVDRIVGSRVDATKEALRRTYKNWSVNLNLTVPLGNVFSRASLAK